MIEFKRKKYKILFDCTDLSYIEEQNGHRAGIFNVALNLYKILKQKDVEITLFCNYKRYYFVKHSPFFKNTPIIAENSFVNKMIGKLLYIIKYMPIRIQYAILILLRYYDRYCHKTTVKNINQIKQFDAYFSPFMPPSKDIIASGIPSFRIIHDLIPIVESGMPKNPKNWCYQIYNSINSKEFYMTDSEYTRQDVLKYFGVNGIYTTDKVGGIKEENIKTCLLGVDERFLTVTSSQQTPSIDSKNNMQLPSKYVLSLCTLGKRKNIPFLVKNFFEFINKNHINDLYLVLAGGMWKSFEKELEKSLKNIDKSKIIFTGYVDDEDLPQLYANALMFIYPSLYEGFGLPVLEAMASSCPVICSNTTSLPEVIGDCGIRISPTSDEDCIKAYEKMYYDEDFRNKCSELGKLRAKDFSWDKCATEILEFIYKNIQ